MKCVMKIRSSYTEVNQEDDYDEGNDNCDCSSIHTIFAFSSLLDLDCLSISLYRRNIILL